MNTAFKRSAVAGIAHILCSVPLMGMALVSSGSEEHSTAWITTWIALYSVSLVCYVLFMLGFRELGDRTNNLPLEIATSVLIAFSFVDYGYSITEFLLPRWAAGFFGLAILFLAGILSAGFGFTLFRLKTTIGGVATAAGVLELIIGVSFVTLVMMPVGLLLYFPALIVETYILFRVAGLWAEQEIEEPPPLCPDV